MLGQLELELVETHRNRTQCEPRPKGINAELILC